VDFNKIAVPVEINDNITVYEDKRVNAARNKDVHEFIDTIFCDWDFYFCKLFRESWKLYFPEILMYKWYHYVTVLAYYLIRENVKTIPLLTVVNVILSNYRYYIFSKDKINDTLWRTDSAFEHCISLFTTDTLLNNKYLKLALLSNESDAKELGVPLHLPENSTMYERNKAITALLKKSADSGQIYTKDIADLILTYDGDDYIPCVPLDLFGDELFNFVSYIKHNIENVSNG
jgi:hypothetical protein